MTTTVCNAVPRTAVRPALSACEQEANNTDCKGCEGYRTYIKGIDKVVRDLDLLHNGEPASWAAEFVLANVIYNRFDRVGTGYTVAIPKDAVVLRCEVSPNEAYLKLSEVPSRHEVRSDPDRQREEEIRESQTITAHEYFSFDEWDEVKREAHEMFDR